MKQLLLVLIFITAGFADQFKAGFGSLKFDYEETSDSGVFLDSETNGWNDINGYALSYSYDIGNLDENSELNSVTFEVRYLKGDTNYDGYLQNINTGALVSKYQNVTENDLFESKITLQRTRYTKNYDVGLFTSYGIRDWKRDMTKSPYGYKEVYNWKFYDIGIAMVGYDGAWEIGLKAAYQKAFNPTMEASINGKTVYNLGDTTGYYYKIPLGYNINKNFKIELEYEYNEWKIGKSNIVNNTYEPQSTTQNSYLFLNIVYRY